MKVSFDARIQCAACSLSERVFPLIDHSADRTTVSVELPNGWSEDADGLTYCTPCTAKRLESAEDEVPRSKRKRR